MSPKKAPSFFVTGPNDQSDPKMGKLLFEQLSFEAKTTTEVLTKNWSLLYSFKISGMAKNQGDKFLIKKKSIQQKKLS